MLSHATVSAGRGRLKGDARLSMEEAALWADGALVGDALDPMSGGAVTAACCAGDIATVTLFLQFSFDLPRGDALGLAASGGLRPPNAHAGEREEEPVRGAGGPGVRLGSVHSGFHLPRPATAESVAGHRREGPRPAHGGRPEDALEPPARRKGRASRLPQHARPGDGASTAGAGGD